MISAARVRRAAVDSRQRRTSKGGARGACRGVSGRHGGRASADSCFRVRHATLNARESRRPTMTQVNARAGRHLETLRSLRDAAVVPLTHEA